MASKPTSSEQFLNSSLIDGKERVRISKQQTTGQKLWENFAVDFTGFLRWLLPNIIVPPASLQFQSKWTETNTSSVRYIQEKSLTTTAASLRALSGNYNADAWYFISDAQSSFGIIRVRAINASNLEKKATLIKGGVSYDASYIIDNGSGVDVITFLRDELNNNTLSRFPDVTDGIINIIPFDGTWSSNVINSGSYTISDVTKCVINNSELHSCSVSMDDNGSINPIGCIIGDAVSNGGAITITGKTGGQQAHIFGYRGGVSCFVSALNGAGVDGCRLEDNSNLSVDDNGADGTTGTSSLVLANNTLLTILGVAGGVGTTLSSCSIYDMNNSVTIKGGESYQKKELCPSLSTFDGSRTITADGAWDFVDSDLVANYNRSFIGIWTITAAAPHSVTSFVNRQNGVFSHEITFILGAGSSTITFVDNGADIIMKGSANAALAGEGDFVTFRYVNQVAYEVNRGIY